ncbi:MAG: hypothetical protein Q8K02_11810 [Flavobacterium sp.]|nr:hypothetical protein [Flavobacterium sp.]
MKYLKIENNKGFFLKQEKDQPDKWIEIDKISKDDLMNLLEMVISNDFEMDDYLEENIAHKAHQIVYKSIFEKFTDLIKNKKTFADECDSQFRSAIEKYESSE